MSMHVIHESRGEVAIGHFLFTCEPCCYKFFEETGMVAIKPSYYNFTKEENNKLRKNKHGFRLEKMRKDYKLEGMGFSRG